MAGVELKVVPGAGEKTGVEVMVKGGCDESDGKGYGKRRAVLVSVLKKVRREKWWRVWWWRVRS